MLFLMLFLYFSLLFSSFLRVRNQSKEGEKQRKNKRKEKEKEKEKQKKREEKQKKRKENRRPSVYPGFDFQRPPYFRDRIFTRVAGLDSAIHTSALSPAILTRFSLLPSLLGRPFERR